MTINGLIDPSLRVRQLSTTATEHLKSSYYEVRDFGFLRLTSDEKYAQTWYPTPQDIVPAGWFDLDIHNASFGDYNGDGLVDVLLQPMLFTHVVPHKTIINPLFLLQDGLGGFKNPQAIMSASAFPDKHMLYRAVSADFNRDGRDDVALSAMPAVTQGSASSITVEQSPVVVFGSQASKFSWTDSYSNFSVRSGGAGSSGYNTGHSIASGDFNGDGYEDWFSNWYVFLNDKAGGFQSSFILPSSRYPAANSAVSADFNEDGFDDLIYSTMPNANATYNGGDLIMLKGGASGLQSASMGTTIPRSNDIPGNVGTNFMVAMDINGDDNIDLVFMEHYWTTDSGDSTYYYSKAKLRAFLGDGQGNLRENSSSIQDPYAGRRHGEGNIHVVDVNGDGWKDLVLTGYQINQTNVWNSGGREREYSTVFLNDRGTLRYVDPKNLAYVEPYQFAGDEFLKPGATKGVSKLIPVDLGNDGMMDFVGFVQTQLVAWPQVQQRYTYAYVVKATAPLGRDTVNEVLVGTQGPDRIFGFDGDDLIQGGSGNDTIDGGSGTDTAIYSGKRSDYTISKTGTSWIVVARTGMEGTDNLINIERVKFSDGTLVSDILGAAGGAYRVYKAAFNRDPMQGDTKGLGYWIAQIDKGMNLTEVAARFVDSNEFRSLYGTNPTNEQFLTKLYTNVLGRQPEASGFNWWLNELNTNPTKTRAKVLADFAESAENQAGVLGLIGNGITYEPWVG